MTLEIFTIMKVFSKTVCDASPDQINDVIQHKRVLTIEERALSERARREETDMMVEMQTRGLPIPPNGRFSYLKPKPFSQRE